MTRTIEAFGAGDLGDIVRSATSSLPISLRKAPANTVPDIAVVGPEASSGAGEDAPFSVWVGMSPRQVDDAVCGRPGIVALPWSSNPALRAAAEWAASIEPYRLESSAILDPSTDASTYLFDQVAVAEALAGPLSDLRLVSWRSDGYVAVAGFGAGRRAALTAVYSSALSPRLTATLFADDGDIAVDLPDWTDARPGIVSRTTMNGIESPPTLWETGMRAALRRALDGDADDASQTLRRARIVTAAVSRVAAPIGSGL